MGVHQNVGLNNFPQQGRNFNRAVEVCFNYNTNDSIAGKIVRDDNQEPFLTIISLADGRFVMASECQYRIIN